MVSAGKHSEQGRGRKRKDAKAALVRVERRNSSDVLERILGKGIVVGTGESPESSEGANAWLVLSIGDVEVFTAEARFSIHPLLETDDEEQE